ncbi:MAG: zf-HC2 domain-containing protein [Planctomycetales bacterium]|nr:zf-HC2 domain-containing protein [Planctomycetales bacterium]
MSQRSVPEPWTPCEPGQLSTLAHRLNNSARGSSLRVAGVAMAICAAGVLLAGLFFSGGNADAPPRALACPEVIRHLPRYAHGDCPSALSGQIAAHLEHCPRCRQALEKLRAQHAEHGPARRRLFAAREQAVRLVAARPRFGAP